MNLDTVTQWIVQHGGDMAVQTAIKAALYQASPVKAMPVDFVRWLPIEEVVPNEYNPNSVATVEMKLLHTSIDHDGYTQPVVVIFDEAKGKYVIVDGFHRYYIMRSHEDIRGKTGGLLPCVVIEKDENDRMASTVRHNRARGSHSVSGMSTIVFEMLDNGWPESRIAEELGMEAEEISRLKYVTGFAKLFENVEYQRAWKSRRQIEVEQSYKNQTSEEQ